MSSGNDGSAPAPDPSINQAQTQLNTLGSQASTWLNNYLFPNVQSANDNQVTQTGNTQTLDNTQAGTLSPLTSQYAAGVTNDYLPSVDAVVKDAQNYNTQGNFEQQAGQAVGDVINRSNASNTALTNTQRSYGIDPSSGAAMGLQVANQNAEVGNEALAANTARTAAQTLGWNKLLGAANAASGLPSAAIGNAGGTAATAASGLAAGQVPVANNATAAGTIATGMGIPLSAAGTSGSLGLGTYQQQINAWNAQQQASATSSAGWGQAVGAGLGAVGAIYGGPAGWAAGQAAGSAISGGMSSVNSDRRLKSNIVEIGELPNGLKVYEYDIFGKRTRGVMADEAILVRPDVVSIDSKGYMMVNYGAL